MIIIGHRGSDGEALENTLKSIAAGMAADADIIHVDIRLTHDKIPILLHDASLRRTHGFKQSISSLTYERLEELTGSACPPRLDAVLDKYFGVVLLNLELHSLGSGRIVSQLLAERAGKQQSKWDNVLLSSSKISELIAARHTSRQANLALLQNNNPFAYIAYHRFLQFTAIGFHRLHTNKLALEIARKAKLFTFAYTVDRPQAAVLLAEQGIDGIVTDHPAKLVSWLASVSHKKPRH